MPSASRRIGRPDDLLASRRSGNAALRLLLIHSERGPKAGEDARIRAKRQRRLSYRQPREPASGARPSSASGHSRSKARDRSGREGNLRPPAIRVSHSHESDSLAVTAPHTRCRNSMKASATPDRGSLEVSATRRNREGAVAL
jgi:hypothetical protein